VKINPQQLSELEQKARDELNVSVNDTFETIRKNYRSLIKKFHPDRNPDDPEAIEKCRKLTVAYDLLCKQNHQSKTKEELEIDQYVWGLFESFWPVSEEYKASKIRSLKEEYQARLVQGR